MIKRISFFKRRAGMTHEEFREYYETKHVKVFEKHLARPGIEYYARRYLSPVPDSITGAVRETGFDVVMEVWLSDPNWYDPFDEEFLKIVAEDEERLFDREHMYFYTVDECETDLQKIREKYAA